jgi:DtxR family transcriptional regulator, Mn-dependent transcriptional regulator
MLPSHTVENYLKAIFQAQTALSTPDGLVPMGQLASALGVVPGTATTMVKALAESGLVRYEPYSGVRLTKAGEKLAALVLRRHRLIELFLVKVMGMSWTEVHDEAEHLEHAVSDRLIDRIDEMLGRPAVDPHGDPIPGPEGTVTSPAYETLLTCALHAPMQVSRVSDQDSEFLRFAERHDLRPGQVVEVEERDAAADSVRLRGHGERIVTIGARAASKVLVQAVQAIVLCVLLGGVAAAQTPSPAPAATGSSRPFEITDNSFLVEEAFNQERGIFQNIFGAVRSGGEWAATFTQEWPAPSMKHQFSYTIPFGTLGRLTGLGDVFLNYRYQLSTDEPGRPAFAPRVSLILPTGDDEKGFGDGSLGVQVNLPFSKQQQDLYFHWNGGFTLLPGVGSDRFQTIVAVDDVTLLTPHLSGSAIWRVRPMFNLMVESVLLWPHRLVAPGLAERTTAFTFSPGARGGWNIGDQQLILGAAIPITWTEGNSDAGAFFYLSYELPFKR